MVDGERIKLAKICWQIITFNSDEFLDEVIQTIKPYGPIVCTEGPVGWWAKQGYVCSTDETKNILLRNNIPTECGVWQEKDEMVNASLKFVPDETEWLWSIDSDELYHTRDIERIIKLLDKEQYDAVAFHTLSFFAGFFATIGGFEYNFPFHRINRYYPGCKFDTHRPPTILAQDGIPWREHKFLSEKDTEKLGIFINHYSYTLPNQTEAKTRYYESMGGTIPEYFKNVWLKWATGSITQRQEIEDLHDGVHNWEKSRRGPSRTIPFTGEHPRVIRDAMPRLRKRFDDELKQWM